jgi:hypothetical protein
MIEGLEFPVNNLTFILTPDKIYIRTKYQCFYLEARTHYWERRLMLIRTLVQLNEIRNLEELSGYCAGGNILWQNTSIAHGAQRARIEL